MAPVSFDSLDYMPPSEFGGPAAFLICIVALGFGVGAAILCLLLHARALSVAQRRTRAELEGAALPLSPGPRRFVKGRVDVDGADDVVIEVDIQQTVKDRRSKNDEWHEWRETTRNLRSAPFYLVQPNGEAVYVEPGPDLRVVDALANEYPADTPYRRVRAAAVRRGEELYAYGDLHSGAHARTRTPYRDGGTGWILKAPRTGPMLFATQIIRDRYTARISSVRHIAFALFVVFGALHTIFTLPYVAAAILGRSEMGYVIDVHDWATADKHGRVVHQYGLTVQAEDGFALTRHVSYATYAVVTSVFARGDTAVVPLLRTLDWDVASFVGDRPSIPEAFPMLGLVAIGVALGVGIVFYRQNTAWYDRQRLVERGGPGKWIETRPRHPIDPNRN
jgi:hypothetical protein